MNIRQIIFMTALAAFGSMEAHETNDTVRVIENVTSLTVSKNADTTTVDVIYDDADGKTRQLYKYEMEVQNEKNFSISDFPSDWGMSFPFINKEPGNSSGANEKRVKRYFIGLNHIYWGWRFNYTGNASISNCFDVGIRNILGVAWRRGKAEFETGLGIGLSRQLGADGMVFVKDGDRLTVSAVADGINVKHSRLDVFGFQVPLIYNQKFSGLVSTSIGAMVTFNTYAKAWNELQDGNVTIKNDCKGLHQNLIGVEPYVSVQIDDVGVYATWKPTKLFDSRFGPEIKSWSLGVELLF